MNYTTRKIEINGQIVEVPVFREKVYKNQIVYNPADGHFYDGDLVKFTASEVELIPIWQPELGERVLYYSDETVLLGIFNGQSNGTYSVSGTLTANIAKYDPSKPIPETWAEVEKTGEVLRV